MGRKLNLDHLSEEECEQVLKVIQRDFELRQKEQKRLGTIEQEITEEDTKAQIIAKKPDFNENYCMRCFSRFFPIFNAKVQCKLCKYFTCKSCAEWDKKEKVYVCKVCDKQTMLQKESNEWFYNNVRERFKRFGSAKVVRSLYKRKTDSDSESEVWSRSLPQVYNSAPSDRGKRSRPSLSTAFSMNVDGTKKDEQAEAELIEEEIVAQRRPLEQSSSAQYTCKLASGRESFEDVKQAEVEQFREQLDGVIAEVTRTLENQSPAAIPNGDVTAQQQYEKLLDNQRLQLSDTLSGMAQSLHIAIDNQNVNDPVRNPEVSNPAARHQLVQQVQQHEVEAFIGHPINQNELSSQTTNGATGGPERTFEDILASAVIQKIVSDYEENQKGQSEKEEADLHRQLTKLSNKATVSQLHDLVSESETDGEITSPRSVSDMDTHSELSELSIVTKSVDVESSNLSPLTPISDSQKSSVSKGSVDSGIKMAAREQPTTGQEQEVNNNGEEENVTRLWERVEGTSEAAPEIEDHWKTVEAKRSEVNDDEEDGTVRPSVTDDAVTMVLQTDLKTMKEIIPATPIVHLKSVVTDDEEEEEMESETKTRRAPTDTEQILELPNGYSSATHDAPLFSDNRRMSGSDEFSGLDFANNRRVPLPSFDTDDFAERSEVDLDDFGRYGSDPDLSGTGSSQVSFGASFANNSLFTDRSRISAYDNYGDKKVGRDTEGPVFMFVPRGGEKLRVGDRDIDDLSDLSENEVGSEDFSDELSEDGDEQGGYFDEEGHFITGRKPKKVKRMKSEVEDSCVGTDDLEDYIRRQNQEKEAQEKKEMEEREKAEVAESPTSPTDPTKLNKLATSELIDEETDEDEDADPSFVQRPMKRLSVTEGEPVTFECEVGGSKPIDVFWYKDMVEIFDLADDDRCELNASNGKHAITMYNTTKSDAGPYLCIAINEQGQCSRHFKLTVKESEGDKSTPEFLKPLSDVEVTEGQFVKLKVKVKGYPQPRIVWYKDGKKIKADDQFRFEKLGNRDYILAIEYVTLDEDAEYTVVAKNIAGEAKTRCQLIVEPRQEEDSSMAISMESAPSSKSSLTSSHVDSSLYPDTSDLMRLAQQVQAKRGHVTETATDMLQSADQMSSLHRQLDAMDRKLDNMEDEVKSDTWTSERNGNNMAAKSRQQIIQEQRDMRSSAANIRSVTNRALDLLAADDNTTSAVPAQKQQTKTLTTEFLTPLPVQPTPDLDDEVELHLSYAEYERLYNSGIIRRQQIVGGKCKRRDFLRIRDFLQQNMSATEREAFDSSYDIVLGDDYAAAVDCGLKRVDSKRYKREYEVNREGGNRKPPPKWEVQFPMGAVQSSQDMEVVPSTPAGLRENPMAQIAMNEAEDQIYLASGRVFGLEDRVKDLEQAIEDEETSGADLKLLEDEVARTVAQVNTTEEEVTGVEGLVRSMKQQYDQQTTKSQPRRDSEQSRRLSSSSTASFTGEQRRSSETRWGSSSHSPLQSPSYNSTFTFPQQQQQQQQRVVSPVVASSSFSVQSHVRKMSADAPPALPSSPPPQAAVPTSPLSKSFTPYAGAKPRASSFQEQRQQEPVQMSASFEREARKQSLKGELREESVPESRTEVEEDMPSVKNLLSRFKDMETPEPDNGSGLKRVYSLTGRDLPQTVRDRLKNQKPTTPVSNIRITTTETFAQLEQPSHSSTPSSTPSQGTDRRYSSAASPTSESEFSPIGQHSMAISPGGGSSVDTTTPNRSPAPSSSSSSFSYSSSAVLHPTQQNRHQTVSPSNHLSSQATSPATSKPNTAAPPVKSSQVAKSNATPKYGQPVGAKSNAVTKKSSASVASPKSPPSLEAPKRNKSSAIMARAAFWDKKITEGEESEFPELPEESFKSRLTPTRHQELLAQIDESHVDLLREKQREELRSPDIPYNLVCAWDV